MQEPRGLLDEDEVVVQRAARDESVLVLADKAVELGREIALKPKRTLKIGKEAFYRQLDMSLDDGYTYASEVMVENMLDAEAEEGIGAFIEKRQPNWPG